MEESVNKDVHCCYNCNSCVAYFGAHKGGTICEAEEVIIHNMLKPNDCPNFDEGHYKTKNLSEANESVKALIDICAKPIARYYPRL